MQLNAVLQNVDFDYIQGDDIRCIQAWKTEQHNTKLSIFNQNLQKPEYASPEQSILRERIPFFKHAQINYLVASCGTRCAYTPFNSKQVEIYCFPDINTSQYNEEPEQIVVHLDEFTALYANQGITAISFAGPNTLLLTSLNFLYIIPIYFKKIKQILQIDLFTSKTIHLKHSLKHSPKTNLKVTNFLSLTNKVFTILKSNQKICLISSQQSTVIFVVNILTASIINQLKYHAKITCIDINSQDQVLIGFNNQSIVYQDLRTGQQNTYQTAANCISVAFQNFSQQQFQQNNTNNIITKDQSQNESNANNSTFQNSILQKIFDQSLQNNLSRECENLACFVLQNDITVFVLNVKLQKIIKTFDFSSKVLNDEEVGGKILDVKWRDCCLITRFSSSIVVSLLYNDSLIVISGILGVDEKAEVDVGSQITICGRGVVKVFGL